MFIPIKPFECGTISETLAKIISIDNNAAVCLLGKYMSVDDTVYAEFWNLNGNSASGITEQQIAVSLPKFQLFITDIFYKLTPDAKQTYGQQWEKNIQPRQYHHFWEKIQ